VSQGREKVPSAARLDDGGKPLKWYSDNLDCSTTHFIRQRKGEHEINSNNKVVERGWMEVLGPQKTIVKYINTINNY